MERQVQRAYERNRFRNMSPWERVTLAFAHTLEAYSAVFTLGRFGRFQFDLVPSWATEALRIQEWDDVERLEKDGISTVREDRFLRKAFLINKDKLKRCFSQMDDSCEEGELINALDPSDFLLPGASCSYAFTVKAPQAVRS